MDSSREWRLETRPAVDFSIESIDWQFNVIYAIVDPVVVTVGGGSSSSSKVSMITCVARRGCCCCCRGCGFDVMMVVVMMLLNAYDPTICHFNGTEFVVW
jgi:hypothetical protein